MTPPSSQARTVRRTTWIGLVANLLLAAFKMAAGILGNSQAVVADAVHSLSDLGSDLAILVGVRFWSKPPDRTHPHGHRRIETLVTLGIGLLLAGTACVLAFEAIVSIPERHTAPPDWIAFYAAAASIVIKEALYRWTERVGRRIRSASLRANAWHHRSDALSSVPAAASVAVAAAYPRWYFVDHVGAVVVSLLIIQAAWKIVRPALMELSDTAAPREIQDEIRRVALATEGVRGVRTVRTRYLGPNIAADIEITVPGDITVVRGHEIAEKVRTNLLEKGPDISDVVVHFEPDAPGPDEEGGADG